MEDRAGDCAETKYKNWVMDKVEIGHTQRLIFEDVERSPVGELESIVVSVELQGLAARREVAAHYGNGFDDLSKFFNDLAEHWFGWRGIKSYSSLERDLQLEAEHTGSHVELTFDLHDPEFPGTSGSWRVRGQLTLEVGEELTQISNAMDEFMAHAKPTGAR